MPDITMCHGGECPKRLDCYRFRAKAEPLQAAFLTPPHRDGQCSYFAPLDWWAHLVGPEGGLAEATRGRR